MQVSLLMAPQEGLQGLKVPQNTDVLLKTESSISRALQGSREGPAPQQICSG